jgi:hypothetical protein
MESDFFPKKWKKINFFGFVFMLFFLTTRLRVDSTRVDSTRTVLFSISRLRVKSTQITTAVRVESTRKFLLCYINNIKQKSRYCEKFNLILAF